MMYGVGLKNRPLLYSAPLLYQKSGQSSMIYVYFVKLNVNQRYISGWFRA